MCRFVVAGEGSGLDELRATVGAIARAPRTRPLPRMAARHRQRVRRRDLVLLTSDNEGMPLSLIEAAAAGRPAVTTDVGSAAEVVVDGVTGIVCAIDDGALAHGGARPVRRRPATRGDGAGGDRPRASGVQSRAVVAERVAALYERLARGQLTTPSRRHDTVSSSVPGLPSVMSAVNPPDPAVAAAGPLEPSVAPDAPHSRREQRLAA